MVVTNMKKEIIAPLPEVYNYFRNFAYTKSGISLNDDKNYLIDDRLGSLATTLGHSSITELYRAAKYSPTETLERKILEALTTNETLFFRDISPFDFVGDVALPALREQKKQTRVIRIWSAACSSGQEVYSFLMTMAEKTPDLLNWKIELLATDLSDDILDRAREGFYSHLEVRRGVPMNLLSRYFTQMPNGWRFCESLRRFVTFKRLNLTGSFAGLGSFDIVLSRYVLIYFDVKTKREIFDKYQHLLGPNGYLFLGASEGIFGVTDKFKRYTEGKCVYFQRA